MSVDVEDYFQVSAFEHLAAREHWDRFESRVCRNTDRLLAIFDEVGVRATFFVLGWVAERFPDLVRRIAAQGHEIASHGYAHRLVYEQTRDEFRDDVRRARAVLESVAGVPVFGFRAPSYSIVAGSMWALDVLIEEGHSYDSSIFPIHHDRYGAPNAPRHWHLLKRPGGALWEVPPSTIRVGRVNLPIAGGGYFRILPYCWTQWGVSRLNRVERRPAVFYVHPWELDPEQPRLPAAPWTRLRHYFNLSRTTDRLMRLLSAFRFDSIGALLGLFPTTSSIPSPAATLPAWNVPADAAISVDW